MIDAFFMFQPHMKPQYVVLDSIAHLLSEYKPTHYFIDSLSDEECG